MTVHRQIKPVGSVVYGAIGIQAGNVRATIPVGITVDLLEGASDHNFTVSLDGDSVYCTIQSHVKPIGTVIQTAVCIEASQVSFRSAVEVSKVPADNGLSVSLHRDCVNRVICAGAWIKRSI